MDDIYYIYILIDPRTNVPFYVGKGHNNRYKHHRYNRNKFPYRPVSQRINEVLESGFPDVIYQFPFVGLIEQESYQRERETIQLIGRTDLNKGSLLNQTDGGEGWSHNRKWTNEMRQKRKQHNKMNPRGRNVVQYSIEGVKVAFYESSNLAAKALNLSVGASSRIRECCKGNANSAYGFMWSYIDNSTPPSFHKKSRRPVMQFTKDGRLVKKYPSIVSASKQTGINAGDISNMCKTNRYKSVGGFVWKYPW